MSEPRSSSADRAPWPEPQASLPQASGARPHATPARRLGPFKSRPRRGPGRRRHASRGQHRHRGGEAAPRVRDGDRDRAPVALHRTVDHPKALAVLVSCPRGRIRSSVAPPMVEVVARRRSRPVRLVSGAAAPSRARIAAGAPASSDRQSALDRTAPRRFCPNFRDTTAANAPAKVWRLEIIRTRARDHRRFWLTLTETVRPSRLALV